MDLHYLLLQVSLFFSYRPFLNSILIKWAAHTEYGSKISHKIMQAWSYTASSLQTLPVSIDPRIDYRISALYFSSYSLLFSHLSCSASVCSSSDSESNTHTFSIPFMKTKLFGRRSCYSLQLQAQICGIHCFIKVHHSESAFASVNRSQNPLLQVCLFLISSLP